MRRMRGIAPATLGLGLGLAAIVPSPIVAQDALNQWLNTLLTTQVEKRQSTKQTEAPQMSGSSTSLVDMSSASDLIGVALDLANLAGAGSSGGEDETTSVIATVSAYAIYAGLRGFDPLDPVQYNTNRGWRRLSLTLGYDNEALPTAPVGTNGTGPNGTGPNGASPDAVGAMAPSTQRVGIYGAKFLLLDRRDPTHATHLQGIDNLRKSLAVAGSAFGNLREEVGDLLFLRTAESFGIGDTIPTDDTESAKLLEELLADARTQTDTLAAVKVLAQLRFENGVLGDPEQLARAIELAGKDEVIALAASRLDVFVRLDETAKYTVEAIRRAPQVSIALTTIQRPTGADEVAAKLIFDLGVSRMANFTLNGAYERKENPSGDDFTGGSVAFQLGIDLRPERLIGRDPIRMALAGSAAWMSGLEPTYKVQLKLTVPILEGVDLPLSVTYATRTDLIEEDDVFGQLGFTFDTASLISRFFK